MIVVDTNVIAYLYLPTEFTAQFLGLPLVSEDGPLRRRFRSTTLSLKRAVAL